MSVFERCNQQAEVSKQGHAGRMTALCEAHYERHGDPDNVSPERQRADWWRDVRRWMDDEVLLQPVDKRVGRALVALISGDPERRPSEHAVWLICLLLVNAASVREYLAEQDFRDTVRAVLREERRNLPLKELHALNGETLVHETALNRRTGEVVETYRVVSIA